MNENRLRETLCRMAKSMFDRGLTGGSTGNISARADDGGLLVSPTGSTFGAAVASAGGFVHMSPRSDGIALGGTSVEGDWSLEPDPDARRRIVEAHIDLFARMS